jgi:hypothetical protein
MADVLPACAAGDNTVLLQQVAAMLLKRYKDSFAGGGVAATWTYLRQWALGALPPNPLTSHDTGPRHLRDPAFLKRALRCAARAAVRWWYTPCHCRSALVGLVATRDCSVMPLQGCPDAFLC